MKITPKTCLWLLRDFGVADELHVPKDVERLKVTNPSPINTLATFTFQLHHYALLTDDTADDDVQYIEVQLMRSLANSDGRLIENPKHPGSYGVPYEGKDWYLYQLDANRQRLDVYLANHYPDYSRSSWQKQIKRGKITVDGAIVTSPKHEISEQSTVQVDMPIKQLHTEQNLPILYLDDDVIVVDKPAGILSHRKNELDDEFTVADFFARFATDDFDDDRPGIVHRLDRDTSGVMIGARTKAAFDFLKEEFASRRAHKTYVALIRGHLVHQTFVVDVPIARNNAKQGAFRADSAGKPAQTTVRTLESNETFSLVSLEPKTGRTHQLRVHMAHLGHPIVGDRLYGKNDDRLYLHAQQLAISLPNGETREFISPIPPEFQRKMHDGN
ncbi:RluA family pseudouridine synthase [Candidatus Saccharibacteria bacterium]|nr:RluA family pseudouridine synthase [Candidatus Saccharibacteria bacterium]